MTERKTAVQCEGGLGNCQSHAEMEGAALGEVNSLLGEMSKQRAEATFWD